MLDGQRNNCQCESVANITNKYEIKAERDKGNEIP